ncbi:unnamed protein product [Symbiodinium sp. CCMP2592]|nr:unnamed protein product [Symbiodinium sp. CCMP2592]
MLRRYFHSKPGEGNPADYTTVKLDQDRFQSTVTIPRLGTKVYTGEIGKEKRIAEILAAKEFFDDTDNQKLLDNLEPSHNTPGTPVYRKKAIDRYKSKCAREAAHAKAASQASNPDQTSAAEPSASLSGPPLS